MAMEANTILQLAAMLLSAGGWDEDTLEAYLRSDVYESMMALGLDHAALEWTKITLAHCKKQIERFAAEARVLAAFQADGISVIAECAQQEAASHSSASSADPTDTDEKETDLAEGKDDPKEKLVEEKDTRAASTKLQTEEGQSKPSTGSPQRCAIEATACCEGEPLREKGAMGQQATELESQSVTQDRSTIQLDDDDFKGYEEDWFPLIAGASASSKGAGKAKKKKKI